MKTENVILQPEDRTHRQILMSGASYLARCGIEDASTDAWLLLSCVSGMDRTSYLLEQQIEMKAEIRKEYEGMLRKRAAHIPLQYITGTQEFMGFSFSVNEHVLIPRQDTEILASLALKKAESGMRVLDLCTGSGCIAISLSKLKPGLQVEGADLSSDALAVARENGERLKAAVSWRQSDLFKELEGSYDMIVSNPPYIRTAVISTLSEEVRAHEPFIALDGHEDGLYFYRRITEDSVRYLKKGGLLLFEIGYDQGEAVCAILRQYGYTEIKLLQDLAGLDRVVMGYGGDYV